MEFTDSWNKNNVMISIPNNNNFDQFAFYHGFIRDINNEHDDITFGLDLCDRFLEVFDKNFLYIKHNNNNNNTIDVLSLNVKDFKKT